MHSYINWILSPSSSLLLFYVFSKRYTQNAYKPSKKDFIRYCQRYIKFNNLINWKFGKVKYFYCEKNDINIYSLNRFAFSWQT